MDPRRGRQGPDLASAGEADSAPAAPGSGRRSRVPLGTPLLWHIVSLVAGAVFLMYVNRGQWFFGDEWDFLADRSVGVGHEGLWTPHNEHWSTGPMLIYGALFRLAGLSSYAPYVAVLVLAHLAAVHLMWRVMLRSPIDPWIATAFCAAFLPFGPGADNLLWAFQTGFVGSVAFGLGAILVADAPTATRARYLAGWGIAVVGLTFSGITVPLVAASAIVAWLRRGFRAFLITGSVPTVVYLIWLMTAGRTGIGTIAPVTEDSLRVFPEFMRVALGAALSLGTTTILTGLVALGLTAIAMVMRVRASRPLPLSAIAAAIGEVLLLVTLAIGRAPFGLEAADATRYVYIAGALLLPLLLVGLSDLVRFHWIGVIVACALAIPWGARNAEILVHHAGLQGDRERLIKEQIVAAGTLFDRDDVLRTRPDPIYTLDLHLSELEQLLPRFSEGIEPSREAILRAALSLQVSVGSSPEFDVAPELDAIRPFDAELREEADCLRARPDGTKPRVYIPLGAPASVALSADHDIEVEALISADGIRPDYTGRLQLGPRRPLFLNMAIDESLFESGDIVIRFPAAVLLCSVDGGSSDSSG